MLPFEVTPWDRAKPFAPLFSYTHCYLHSGHIRYSSIKTLYPIPDFTSNPYFNFKPVVRCSCRAPDDKDLVLLHYAVTSLARQGEFIFPVQLTTSRIGNYNRLMLSLLKVMTTPPLSPPTVLYPFRSAAVGVTHIFVVQALDAAVRIGGFFGSARVRLLHRLLYLGIFDLSPNRYWRVSGDSQRS